MNNTFNFKRFSLLVKRQWLDFGKVYLMSLAILTLVLIAAYFQLIPELKADNLYYNTQSLVYLRFKLPLFSIIGFIFISIVASNYYNALGQKAKATMDLMIPASLFEKLMAGLFYTAFVSVLSYIIIFCIVDGFFMTYLDGLWKHQQAMNYQTGKLTQVGFSNLYTDLTDQNELKYLFAFPFLVASIFLLGSVYFNRFQYIKTALSLAISISLIVYLIMKTAKWLSEDMVRHNTSLSNDKSGTFLIIFLVTLALTFAFWLVTYLRLKEKEV